MDLLNWKIKNVSGAVIDAAQISIPLDRSKGNALFFESKASLGLKAGDILFVEAPIGSPVYKVRITATPSNPDNKDLVQIQTEILPF